MTGQLKDNYGRIARKLRISVTDKCNMKCIYCMPENQSTFYNETELLSLDEMKRLAVIFTQLGIDKIRITGGEPLLRAGIENLVEFIAQLEGIKSVSITTNGIMLSQKVERLASLGLKGVNISLDSLKPAMFRILGGISGLNKVLAGIKLSIRAGLDVKINTVIIRGWNDDELIQFANFARKTGITVRFIEFMPLDGTGIWRSELVFSKKEMIERIEANIGKLIPMQGEERSAPVKLYSFADGIGVIGFIPSMSEPFCDQCDRIRLTSDGKFLTCLFQNPGHDIKNLLRNGATNDELKQYFIRCMKMKQEGVVSLIRINGLKPKLNLMHTIGG
ncbi:MAG TPA: GTP 3',8-cyclase MoaA [Nitrososphaeraceae archaeon]|jgi:cyclic pyranopterin phosphate synthase